MKPLIFGLDFDGTVTAEPAGFAAFCATMRAIGHKVYIVTARYPSEAVEIHRDWGNRVDGVYATSRLAKRKFMKDKGINVSIWIDDFPDAVLKDIKDIFGWASAEGDVIINPHDGSCPEPIE